MCTYLLTLNSTLIHSISSELKGDTDEYYRYYKSFSPGLQEYIEAGIKI